MRLRESTRGPVYVTLLTAIRDPSLSYMLLASRQRRSDHIQFLSAKARSKTYANRENAHSDAHS